VAAPWAMARAGALRALVLSAVLAVAGAALLALASTAASDLWLCLSQVPFGVGCGCTFVNATESVLGSAPSDRAGTAAAINEGAFEFGGVIGVAVLGAVLGSPLVTAVVFRERTRDALWVGVVSVGLAALLALVLANQRGKSIDSSANRGA
jgi:MFS family permease